MSKEAQETTGKKANVTKFILPIVVVILLVGAIGFVAKMEKGIDAQLVESQLNSWIASAQSQYPSTRISYEEVQMDGSVSDRHALLQEVRVVVDIVNPEREPAELEFYFPEVKIMPESARFDAFELTPTQGMVITEDGEVTALAFDPSPTALVKQSKADGGVRTAYELPLVGVWRISDGAVTEEEAEASEEALPAVEVRFGDNSLVSGDVLMGPLRAGSLKINVSPISAQHTLDADEKLSASAVAFDSKWNQTEEARGAASVRLNLENLFSTEEEMPYGAVSVALEGDYDGPMPSDDREIDWSSEKALVDLRQFNVVAKEVGLSGRLNFQTGRGELLPVGEGQIDVKNIAYVLAELRANEMLDADAEKLLSVITQQITGENLDEMTDLSVPIKRVDGGSLQIGNSNFEELFAIFLTGGKLTPPHDAPAEGGEPAAGESSEEAIDEGEVKELFNGQ